MADREPPMRCYSPGEESSAASDHQQPQQSNIFEIPLPRRDESPRIPHGFEARMLIVERIPQAGDVSATWSVANSPGVLLSFDQIPLNFEPIFDMDSDASHVVTCLTKILNEEASQGRAAGRFHGFIWDWTAW